jgi:hypothetical protein
MKVSARLPIWLRLKRFLADQYASVSEFFVHVWLLCRFTHWTAYQKSQGKKHRKVYTYSNTQRGHDTALTRARSAELKRGTLHEILDKHFTFVDIRMSRVSLDLQNVLRMHSFMDSEPPSSNPKEASRKKSTLYRWHEQVSECTLTCISIHFQLHLTPILSACIDSAVYTQKETEWRRFHNLRTRSCLVPHERGGHTCPRREFAIVFMGRHTRKRCANMLLLRQSEPQRLLCGHYVCTAIPQRVQRLVWNMLYEKKGAPVATSSRRLWPSIVHCAMLAFFSHLTLLPHDSSLTSHIYDCNHVHLQRYHMQMHLRKKRLQ